VLNQYISLSTQQEGSVQVEIILICIKECSKQESVLNLLIFLFFSQLFPPTLCLFDV